VNLRVSSSIAAVAAVAAIGPAAANAADPGRWFQTATSETKLEYYQGMASDDDAGHLFFDGFQVGGYRTDLRLREQLAVDPLLPLDVTAAEGFNHIGDLTFTDGRLILPLECYTAGGENGGNTCGRGAFGIASPELGWLGRVPLDPADIAKAMWAEASPDGELVWTSSGDDLLAYAAADIQPGETPIHPVRRLVGAVPPSGITGATFVDDRLFVAGQALGFQVWSIDTETGERQLEIERPYTGESEGLDTVDALGGELHWQIMPFDPEGRAPTFGDGHGTIVSFVARQDAIIRLKARPARLKVGEETEVKVTAYLTYAGSDHPFAGARITAPGDSATTSKNGKATLVLTRDRAGRIRINANKPPISGGRVTLRVTE
jgi:hypothetical protein